MNEDIRVVETLIVHDAEERSRLWNVYREAFERLNQRTPIHHGGYGPEAFDAVLQDEDFNKFLVYADDELVGVTLITNVLTKIPWLNAGYFEDRYPDRSREGKIYFLPAVVIDPRHQDLRRIGSKLLQQALTTLGEDVVLAVDYSDTLRHSLPAFVSRGLGRAFKGEILDRLVYQIFYYEDPS
jgi:ribosomal protein S18 acetylase RimI-like enzyme